MFPLGAGTYRYTNDLAAPHLCKWTGQPGRSFYQSITQLHTSSIVLGVSKEGLDFVSLGRSSTVHT